MKHPPEILWSYLRPFINDALKHCSNPFPGAQNNIFEVSNFKSRKICQKCQKSKNAKQFEKYEQNATKVGKAFKKSDKNSKRY